MAALIACAGPAVAGPHDALIAQHAAANGVPESLVRRVIHIESRGNPGLTHAGNYGLMQIRLGTARGLGYSGDAKGLLDANTNLTYAVKYLAGAWRAAGCNVERAIHLYQRGYYGVRQVACGIAPATANAKPVDVLKPRVVQIETFGAGNMPVTRTRPTGVFEPARMSAQPVTAEAPVPAGVPGGMQLASIPMPPARPDFQAAAKTGGDKPLSRAGRKHPAANAKTADGPVASLVKKLATTDKSADKSSKLSPKPAAPETPSPPPPL